ncbi:MAG: bifunctional biotin--[acetyl-CoA-carboxylase] ligase/biotin operon repressor BirA [Methylovulum sp.]|nr:bifunctional biotin--[acetyl-CoA-carboxylase] ligase/biotin operon repressor BirA [Methylovulum sp.]
MLISDKQKKILTLLADGEFHSGTELALALGVSRSAVWKQLGGLTDLGLQHAAVSGKGYRLDSPLELLTAAGIQAFLNERVSTLISALEIHDQIDSTNRYLAARSQQDATSSGLVCFAEHQTAGKGRRGREWVSPFGNNIYVSILWRFQLGYAGITGLSLAIGVAVIRALKQLGFADVGLKWPNDIYSQGKKLGGILIEVSGESDGPCTAIIGLGLNRFLPDAAADGITQAWTDLSKLNNPTMPDRNQLAGTLLNHLLAIIADFEQMGLQAYLEEWRCYDCLYNQSATLFIGEQAFTGIIAGIDDNGLLLISQANGKVNAFASGEVSFHQGDA